MFVSNKMIVLSSQLAQFSLERIMEMIDPNKRMESTDAMHYTLAANRWLVAMAKKKTKAVIFFFSGLIFSDILKYVAPKG